MVFDKGKKLIDYWVVPYRDMPKWLLKNWQRLNSKYLTHVLTTDMQNFN